MSRKQGPYRTGRIGGLSWTYREGMEALIEPDYARIRLSASDENMVRVRGRHAVGGQTYFVKVFKSAGFGRAAKTVLLGHAAQHEFVASCYLSSRQVRTPEALAVGLSPRREDRAVLVFREIPDAVPVLDLFLSAGPDEREQYLELVAEVTATLHRASFYHRDYHGGNILVTRDGKGSPLLWVVDLHRSSFPRDMSGRRGLVNLADIIHSLVPGMKPGDVGRFLSEYRRHNPAARWDAAEAERIVDRRIQKAKARRLKSRARRCLVNSSEFTVSRRPGEVVYARREIAPGTIDGIIERFSSGDCRIVKVDRKATIALVANEGREVCVKAYLRLGFFGRIKALFGMSRGHNSWRGAGGLVLRGFETPLPLFLVIKRRFFIPRTVYLVTESIAPRVEMDRFILRRLKDASPDRADRFAARFGSVIGNLHRAGIYHRDLKTTNIVVGVIGGDDVSFAFIDLDYVGFSRSVPPKRKAKNLAQIYLSTPGLVAAGTRKVFFESYVDASGAAGDRQTIVRLVGDLVRGKDLMYVSDDGDVVEDARGIYTQLWEDA
jgi:tRNA A-37 threonylcarbamoyl transferase component Bud32